MEIKNKNKRISEVEALKQVLIKKNIITLEDVKREQSNKSSK